MTLDKSNGVRSIGTNRVRIGCVTRLIISDMNRKSFK